MRKRGGVRSIVLLYDGTAPRPRVYPASTPCRPRERCKPPGNLEYRARRRPRGLRKDGRTFRAPNTASYRPPASTETPRPSPSGKKKEHPRFGPKNRTGQPPGSERCQTNVPYLNTASNRPPAPQNAAPRPRRPKSSRFGAKIELSAAPADVSSPSGAAIPGSSWYTGGRVAPNIFSPIPRRSNPASFPGAEPRPAGSLPGLHRPAGGRRGGPRPRGTPHAPRARTRQPPPRCWCTRRRSRRRSRSCCGGTALPPAGRPPTRWCAPPPRWPSTWPCRRGSGTGTRRVGCTRTRSRPSPTSRASPSSSATTTRTSATCRPARACSRWAASSPTSRARRWRSTWSRTFPTRARCVPCIEMFLPGLTATPHAGSAGPGRAGTGAGGVPGRVRPPRACPTGTEGGFLPLTLRMQVSLLHALALQHFREDW